jgi:hypothetical protein
MPIQGKDSNNAAEWLRSTSGALHTLVAPGQYLEFLGTSQTVDNGVVYSATGLSAYNLTVFQVDGAGSLTVQVKTSAASDWSPDLYFESLAAAEAGGGYDVVATATGDGNVYTLRGRYYAIQILSVGVTAVSCWGNHSYA